MTQRRHAGLTLVEVLIAIAVLAIGILAAVGLQTTSLQASSRARIVQEMTKVAESELAIRRSIVSTTADVACITPVGTGFGCAVVVTPCALGGGGAFTCPSASPSAHRITVTVTGPRNATEAVTGLVGLPAAAAP